MDVAVENSRQNLESLTVKELIRDYATPLNVIGRHDMKKADLIDAILTKIAETGLESAASATTEEDVETEVKEVKQEEGTPQEVNQEVKHKDEENPFAEKIAAGKIKIKRKELTDVQKANKMRYVEEAEIGTIVAFKLPGMKVKSAKITRRSTKNKKFKVETTYGTEFVIGFEDVIWVKTNKRWPKGVYNLLKGIGDE